MSVIHLLHSKEPSSILAWGPGVYHTSAHSYSKPHLLRITQDAIGNVYSELLEWLINQQAWMLFFLYDSTVWLTELKLKPNPSGHFRLEQIQSESQPHVINRPSLASLLQLGSWGALPHSGRKRMAPFSRADEGCWLMQLLLCPLNSKGAKQDLCLCWWIWASPSKSGGHQNENSLRGMGESLRCTKVPTETMHLRVDSHDSNRTLRQHLGESSSYGCKYDQIWGRCPDFLDMVTISIYFLS